MTSPLVKLFVKDYQNVESARVRKAYGVLASVVGIVCNVVLCAFKIAAGLLFASIAILADGLNNLSDAGSSVVSLIGFRIADRPADSEHPFGHARVEYITGLIISFIILFLGLQLILNSVEKAFAPGDVNTSWFAVGILCFSILLKLWMSWFNRRLGKSIRSVALKATSQDSFNDVFATFAVLVCTLVAKYTSVVLDAYAGILVACFIMYSGIKIMRDTLSPLLGKVPTRELVSGIVDRIRSYTGVLGIHDLVIHDYGPNHLYVSVHVEVDATVDIMASHELIDGIERDFKADHVELVIHLDPVNMEDETTNELRRLVQTALLSIDPELGLHDFRAVLGKVRKNLIFDVVVPPDYRYADSELRDKIELAVQAKDPTCFTVINIDRNYVGPAD